MCLSALLGPILIVVTGDPMLSLQYTVAVLLAVAVLVEPRIGVLPLIVLIPFEEVLVIDESFTVVKMLGWFILAVWLLRCLADRTVPRVTKGALWGAAIIVLGMASYFWALDASLVLQRIPTAIQLLVFYVMVVAHLPGQPSMRLTLWCYAGSCVLAASYANYQYVVNDLSVHSGRAFLGSSGSVNFLPILIMPAIWWLWTIALGDRNHKLRLLCFVMLIPLIGVVVLTASRGAIAALLATLLVAIIMNRSNIKVYMAIVAIALIGVFVLNGIGDSRLLSRFDPVKILDARGSGRLDIWLVGQQAALSAPVLGHGLDNFPAAYDQHVANTQMVRQDLGFGRASHSIYIGTLVELGSVGLAIFLFFLAHHGVGLIRASRRADSAVGGEGHLNSNHLYSACLLSLIAMLISGIPLDILWRKYFWLTLALAEAAIFLPTLNEAGDVSDSPIDTTNDVPIG